MKKSLLILSILLSLITRSQNVSFIMKSGASGDTLYGFNPSTGVWTQLTKVALTGSAAAAATTGTVSVPMTASLVTCVPSGNITFNATGGTIGQRTTFVITTSGTTSRTLTWSQNFKTIGTLATGTVTAKVFTITFIYDGTNHVELARTAAQ